MAKKLSSFSLQPRLHVLLCSKYETTVPCEPFFSLCSHIFCEWYRMHLRGISFVACAFIDSFPECTVSDVSACEQLFYRKKAWRATEKETWYKLHYKIMVQSFSFLHFCRNTSYRHLFQPFSFRPSWVSQVVFLFIISGKGEQISFFRIFLLFFRQDASEMPYSLLLVSESFFLSFVVPLKSAGAGEELSALADPLVRHWKRKGEGLHKNSRKGNRGSFSGERNSMGENLVSRERRKRDQSAPSIHREKRGLFPWLSPTCRFVKKKTVRKWEQIPFPSDIHPLELHFLTPLCSVQDGAGAVEGVPIGVAALPAIQIQINLSSIFVWECTRLRLYQNTAAPASGAIPAPILGKTVLPPAGTSLM